MRAGLLRQVVQVQNRAVTQDSFGQRVQTWADLLPPVFASVRSLSGRELLAAQGINAEVTHEIVLRYQPELANPVAVAAMRVLMGSRVFDIKTADNIDSLNREIRLLVGEGLTAG